MVISFSKLGIQKKSFEVKVAMNVKLVLGKVACEIPIGDLERDVL